MSHQILSEAYRCNVAAFHAVLTNFTHKHVFTCRLTVFFFQTNKQTNTVLVAFTESPYSILHLLPVT